MSTPAPSRMARGGGAGPAFDALSQSWAALAPGGERWQALRSAGWAVFEREGFPTTRDEAWKYTSLRRLARRAFRLDLPVEAPASADLAELLAGELDGPRLVFLNGRFVPALSAPSTNGDGLEIDALTKVFDDPQRTGRLGELADPEAHRFAALNQAFAGEGARIRTAPDSKIEQPVYVVYLSAAAAEPVACHPRLVIEAGPRSSLTVVEHFVGLNDARRPKDENLTNAVTEVFLAPGAQLEHYRVQAESPTAHHIGGLFAELTRDARLQSHCVHTGGALARQDIVVNLVEPGAHVDLHGLYFVDGKRHTDVHTRVDHRAPHTTSDEEYRGIVTGRGRAVFNGKAVIHPDAQKTDVKQANANLLLSPQAEVDTKPELEIYADDVKASHGATVGQLDENAMFYLLSRGIDKDSAKAMLTFAFAEAVIARMTLMPVRRLLEKAIADNLTVGDLVEDQV